MPNPTGTFFGSVSTTATEGSSEKEAPCFDTDEGGASWKAEVECLSSLDLRPV